MVVGCALGVGIGREAILGLGDADRQSGVAHLFEGFELVAHRLVHVDLLGTVDLRADGADLLDQRHLVGIEQLELALAAVDHLHHGAGDIHCALATLRPMVGDERLDAEFGAAILDQRGLGIGIGAEAVDRDHRHDAEFLYVLDMAGEVRHAGLERLQVFTLELFLLQPAVHLERADAGDQHRAVG